MELRDHLALVKRHWILILVCAVVGAICGAGGALLSKPVYSAQSQLFVSVGGDTAIELAQGNSFSERRVSTYVTLATSPRVLAPVIEELGLQTTASALRESLTVSVPGQTVLIDIGARSHVASDAARVADAVASQLKATIDELEQTAQPAERAAVAVSIVERASTPTTPESPEAARLGVLGLLAGIAAAFVIALVRNLFDVRVRSRSDVAETSGHPVIGTIARNPELGRRQTPLLTEPSADRAEAFRQLRTHLLFGDTEGGLKSVVVTSSLAAEGKTVTAIGLALVLAENGARVLLVDADLRRPRVAEHLGLDGTVGLSSVLTGSTSFREVIQRVHGTEALDVVAAGPLPANPSELLGSTSMRQLVAEWESEYDAVVIDAPPVGPVTDPVVLGVAASGTLVVASTDGRLRRDQLAYTFETLEAVGVPIAGIVLNQMTASARTRARGPQRSAGARPCTDESSDKRPRTRRARRVPR